MTEEEMKAASRDMFKSMDVDGQGWVSYATLRKSLPDLSEEDFENTARMVDQDGSGHITQDEFEAWVVESAKPASDPPPAAGRQPVADVELFRCVRWAMAFGAPEAAATVASTLAENRAEAFVVATRAHVLRTVARSPTPLGRKTAKLLSQQCALFPSVHMAEAFAEFMRHQLDALRTKGKLKACSTLWFILDGCPKTAGAVSALSAMAGPQSEDASHAR